MHTPPFHKPCLTYIFLCIYVVCIYIIGVHVAYLSYIMYCILSDVYVTYRHSTSFYYMCEMFTFLLNPLSRGGKEGDFLVGALAVKRRRFFGVKVAM